MLLFFHYFWAIFFWEQPFSQLISYTCHLYLSFAHRLYFLNLNSKYADIHSIAPRNSHGTVFAALSSAESERSCHDFDFTYVFGIGIDIATLSISIDILVVLAGYPQRPGRQSGHSPGRHHTRDQRGGRHAADAVPGPRENQLDTQEDTFPAAQVGCPRCTWPAVRLGGFQAV